MFRGPWACTWAGFMWEPLFQLIMGFSIGPSSVGCMLSTSGNVFRTKNSMRYVRYEALKDLTMQRLPKHCVCRSNNTFIQPTDEIYYLCTLKTAAAATRAGGATEAVSRPEEWRRSSLFQTKHQPLLQKGYQKRTSVCIKLNKDPTTPSVRI